MLEVTDKKNILYNVTVYDFPKSTVRHQVAIGESMVEKVTTFEEWLKLEARRIGKRTQMILALHFNKVGQVALVVLRKTPSK